MIAFKALKVRHFKVKALSQWIDELIHLEEVELDLEAGDLD